MQSKIFKIKNPVCAILFALILQTIVSAQSNSKQIEENRIGKGVVPVADYDPQTAPLAKRPEGARKPYADFFGTGRTSFAVFNTFNPAPVEWKLKSNGSNESRFLHWGRDEFNFTDMVNPGYFDGDNKADVTVWRKNYQRKRSVFC